MGEYAPEHDRFPAADPGGPKPLDGVRVVDAGNLVAVPAATSLLGDFGADVIKIEHPEHGDGLRQLDPHKDGVGLWWKVTGRNKRSVTLDLSTDAGRTVFEDLAREADVVAENFRPGTMERWGLGPDDLHAVNPDLVILRISGYGQTGPYRERPGFGRVAGAFSGMTTLIGEADGPPMTPGYPLGDGVSGVFGALGTMLALFHREVNGGGGQVIDLALYESLFRLLEFSAIEYDQLQQVRTRTGNTHAYVAPSSTYETADGEYVTMTASTPTVWERLCAALDREDLLEDERFVDNEARVEHSDAVNGVVRDWVADRTREEVEAAWDAHDVPYSTVYDIADAFRDEQYRERPSLVRVPDEELGEAVVQNVVPRLSATPGGLRHLGPRVGEHNEEVYGGLLGYDDGLLDDLEAEGVI